MGFGECVVNHGELSAAWALRSPIEAFLPAQFGLAISRLPEAL
jgi:hypothetical protein